MIQGFNHNIKYRDIVFHIQTEDSGTKSASIITHIFVGGNIIATVKSSYSNVINASQMKGVIRQMMEKQHKTALKDLVNGRYENEIDMMLGIKKQYSEKDDIAKLAENGSKEFSPHLTENKQEEILNKKDDNEATLDQLILSFLEKESK